MPQTPRLGLVSIDTQQLQKEVTHNANLRRLDALVQTVVQDKDLAVPPGAPTAGFLWLLPAAPTGAWSGQGGKLAQFIDGTWSFYDPFEGLRVFVADEDVEYRYTGTAWEPALPRVLVASATYDPPNLVDGAGVSTTLTVTGAALGDFVLASFSLDLLGITLTGYVSAANTVTLRFQNESGGVLDLASGTLRVLVVKAL
jgi:hypothetical protein